MDSHLNLRRIFRRSVRLYSAPIVGAYKGIRDEFRRIDAEDDEQTKRASPLGVELKTSGSLGRTSTRH